VFQTTKGLLKCDIDKIDPIKIDSKMEPTATYLSPTAGYLDTALAGAGPFEFVKQDRHTYYAQTHFQSILSQITQNIIDDLLSPPPTQSKKKARVFVFKSRHQLFPKVFSIVNEFVKKKVTFGTVDQRELGLEKYVPLAVERIRENIHPDDSAGEPP